MLRRCGLDDASITDVDCASLPDPVFLAQQRAGTISYRISVLFPGRWSPDGALYSERYVRGHLCQSDTKMKEEFSKQPSGWEDRLLLDQVCSDLREKVNRGTRRITADTTEASP
jgi:hypothetical protein